MSHCYYLVSVDNKTGGKRQKLQYQEENNFPSISF